MLFQTNDEEEINGLFLNYITDVNKINEALLKQYLFGLNYSSEEIEKYLNGIENPEMENYIMNSDIPQKLGNAIKMNIKLYFVNMLPKLSQEEKNLLETYLNNKYELLKLDRDIYDEYLKISKGLKEMINNQDNTSVNLGGNLTQPAPAPSQNVVVN